MTTLNEIARAAATTAAADDADQRSADQARSRTDFLGIAHVTAENILGTDAAALLTWQYTPWDETPEDVEEAIADLAPGRLHDFALRYSYTAHHTGDGDERLELRATCTGCGCITLTTVTGLVQLGRLLADDDAHTEQTGSNGSAGEDDVDPLRGITALQTVTDQLAQFVRCQAVRHPKVALTVDRAGVRFFGSGPVGGEAHLSASSAEAVAEIAAALGTTADVRIVGGGAHMPVPYAFRQASADLTHGDIEVHLSGITHLTDDEAAAWLAEQNQPTSETTDGPYAKDGESQ
ncbi:DUF6195 family protein [Streptomyces sp. NPDC096080]|uniref:DUF6195 family protein n=1 Tax=Streptomyces sp. NPDC096080 TaxID=3156693 RepID=UPI00332EE788